MFIAQVSSVNVNHKEAPQKEYAIDRANKNLYAKKLWIVLLLDREVEGSSHMGMFLVGLVPKWPLREPRGS